MARNTAPGSAQWLKPHFKLLRTFVMISLFLVGLAGYEDERDPDRTLNLQYSRISLPYRSRLESAYQVLVAFILAAGASPTLLRRARSANSILVNFIQHLYASRNQLSTARHAVLAVQTKFR